jgi:DNA helicase-2/ATP-dependent DNA helicase PcrA
MLIEHMVKEGQGLGLGDLMDTVIETSGLIPHYQKEKGEKGLARIENLEELVNAARTFKPEPPEDLDPLLAFLAQTTLDSGETQADASEDYVHLMTLHSAKGLEFPLVFLVGLEEGLFPHQRSAEDATQLEEERRLCYVGITRAKETLVLTHAECRRLHGSEFFPQPSRFLRELPADLLAEVRVRGEIYAPVVERQTRTNPFSLRDPGPSHGLRLGQRVAHQKFGEGVVLKVEGDGGNARVQVNFQRTGAKWLVAAYAGLQALDA